MGILLEKSDRSRIALAERTIGGLNKDISSDNAAELGTWSHVSMHSILLIGPMRYLLTSIVFVHVLDVACPGEVFGKSRFLAQGCAKMQGCASPN